MESSLLTKDGHLFHIPQSCNRGKGYTTAQAQQAFDLLDAATKVQLGPNGQAALLEVVNKAPGTFFHVLTVAQMMPAQFKTPEHFAAVLLHDIGKTITPEKFAENCCGECQRPEAHYLLAHVEGGRLMSEYYKLPDLARAAILQHHGTLPISQDVSYTGSAPDSLFTATLMMVDTLEALHASGGLNKDLWQEIFTERADLGQFTGLDIKRLQEIIDESYAALTLKSA